METKVTDASEIAFVIGNSSSCLCIRMQTVSAVDLFFILVSVFLSAHRCNRRTVLCGPFLPQQVRW